MKELLKNTFIYSIARIIPGITGFILLPIYTNYLEPSEYGKVQSMQVLGLFLVIIFSLASERSIFRLFYDYNNEVTKKKFIGNVTILIAISVSIVGCLIFLFRDYVNLIFDSIEFYPYYVYIITYAMLTSFSYIPLNLFQVKGKALRFSLYSISGFLLTTFFIIFFLIYKKEGASAILKGQLYGSGIMLFFYFIEIYKNAIFKIDFQMVKNILSFSIPFIPVLFSSWLMNMSSRVFLDLFIKDDNQALYEIGIYSFAFKIASISAIVIGSIYTAYNPIFYKEANRVDQTGVIEKLGYIKYLYSLSALLICFSISFVSKEVIVLFFNIEYSESFYLVPVLSLCFFFTQMVALYNLMVYQEKKTKSVMINLIISSILTIIVGLILIPKFYSHGAAMAALLGVVVNTYLQYKNATKSYYVNFKLNKILLMTFLLFTIIYLDMFFNTLEESISLGIKISIISMIFVYFYMKNRHLLLNKKTQK